MCDEHNPGLGRSRRDSWGRRTRRSSVGLALIRTSVGTRAVWAGIPVDVGCRMARGVSGADRGGAGDEMQVVGRRLESGAGADPAAGAARTDHVVAPRRLGAIRLVVGGEYVRVERHAPDAASEP